MTIFSYYTNHHISAVRVVFDVSLEGSARKLITVRSALTVSNQLPHPIIVRLENTALKIGGDYFVMAPRSSYSKPQTFL